MRFRRKAYLFLHFCTLVQLSTSLKPLLRVEHSENGWRLFLYSVLALTPSSGWLFHMFRIMGSGHPSSRLAIDETRESSPRGVERLRVASLLEEGPERMIQHHSRQHGVKSGINLLTLGCEMDCCDCSVCDKDHGKLC